MAAIEQHQAVVRGCAPTDQKSRIKIREKVTSYYSILIAISKGRQLGTMRSSDMPCRPC